VAAHLRREILISVPTWTDGDEVHLKPKGVLYFGSVAGLERTFMSLLHEHPRARRMVVHLDGLGRVDVTGALVLQTLLAEAREAGLEAQVADIPPQAQRIVARVLAPDDVA
jgi:sulfate permease, SulP family